VLAILRTAAVFGVEAYPVGVEVGVSGGGLPAMAIVGLPDASVRESHDRVQGAIHSVARLLPPGASLLTAPPFRAPHHTGSAVALVGGDTVPRPGEISLAHR
jgi:predicted ATPase with chaperone activity